MIIPSILASLNLPACIEEVGGAELPQSLLEKGEILREKGGVATLQTLLTELPDLVQRNKDIANEVSFVLLKIMYQDSDYLLHSLFSVLDMVVN